MIEKMTKYSLISLSAYSPEFIERLQQCGLMDIRRSLKPVDTHSAELMDRAAAIKEEMAGTALKKELAGITAGLRTLEKERSAAEKWGEYDAAALEALAEAGYAVRFHSISSKKYDPLWEERVPIAVIADDGKNTLFASVSDSDGAEIPKLLEDSEIGRPRKIAEIDADLAELTEKKDTLEQKLAELPARATDLQKRYDAVMSEMDAHLALNSRKGNPLDEDSPEAELNGYVNIYEGYAPTDKDALVSSLLDEMPVYYTAEAAREDDTPVRLKNNWFSRQFEVFTEMYGMPVYNEFDPTPVVAPFYLLFFSMCMGDAGYGILLMLIAWYLGKKMPGSGLGKMHSLIFLLGAGTFIVGIFLGTFFGTSLFNATWVPDGLKKMMLVEGNTGKIAGFDPQIILALGIGIFHICLAMIVKTACMTSRKGFRSSLGTWGWTLLVVGGIVTAALAIAGKLGPDALRMTIIILGTVSALGIFFFNTPGRNPLKNVGTGLWDSYNMITGLLGDTLSYLRLYALGLAGGMLGGAFNSLAGMLLGDNPTWQWVPFILIVLIGHALNIAMSSLGAMVHPMRLIFVEYFKNSGYEGKGVRYTPLTKENNNN